MDDNLISFNTKLTSDGDFPYAWESGQNVHAHGLVYGIHDRLIKDPGVVLGDNKSLSEFYQLDI